MKTHTLTYVTPEDLPAHLRQAANIALESMEDCAEFERPMDYFMSWGDLEMFYEDGVEEDESTLPSVATWKELQSLLKKHNALLTLQIAK